MVERHEVVEHRRAHAAALRRVHPLAEDERVEPAREPLDGRAARRGSTPCGARARRAAGRAARARRDPVERRADRGRAAQARRRERDELVPARRRPRTCRRASRGCSSRSPCAGGRAARRRRRSSRRLLVDERVEVGAELRGRPCCPGSRRPGRASARRVKRTTHAPVDRLERDPQRRGALRRHRDRRDGPAAHERVATRVSAPGEERRVASGGATSSRPPRAAKPRPRHVARPTRCRSGRGRSRVVSDASGPRRRQSVVPRSSRATTAPSGVTEPSSSAYGASTVPPVGVADDAVARRSGRASRRCRPASAATCSRRRRRAG